MLEVIAQSINYIRTVIFLIISVMGLLILTSIYIEPLTGDLTRLGGYAERDFGWNGTRKVLSNKKLLPNTYDKYYDIVVLGDSFSKPGLWQAFFTEKFSLGFTTLHWDDTTVEKIVNNQIFIKNPPKLLILETGVRYFPKNFSSETTQCEPGTFSQYQGVKFAESALSENDFIDINRDTSVDWSEINLKIALTYLENSILRSSIHNDFSKVKKYALTRGDLFSNRSSDEILLLNTWYDSKHWSNEEVNKSICNAINIQNTIQANGKTIVIFMPIPDKGSAYEKYVVKPAFASMDEINQRLLNSQLNITKLDMLLRDAIEKGEKDVYLPNDTHFGTKGYEIAAKSVNDLLVQLGVVTSANVQ